MKPEGQEVASVPQWSDLPAYAQDALTPRGYHQGWFAAADADLRLTVLNLYVKLSGMNLWRFVAKEWASSVGCLQFHATSVADLKSALTASRDFLSPETSLEKWSSRELRGEGQLHFKHFTPWPTDCVQAHIDREGLLLHSQAWWLLPVIPLAQMARHGFDDLEDGYKKVQELREILLRQGWDPAPLLGATGAKRVPT